MTDHSASEFPHRVTVMGLGLFGGGAGAARYCARRGSVVTVTDTAPADKLAPSVESLAGLGIDFVLGGHRDADFTDTDLVVANQSVRPDNKFLVLARAAGIPIVTEIGLALSLNRSPWVGVTGSSGKSTTSALIAAMLARHDARTLFGGNIGGDLVSRVADRPADAPLVAELSSFQLTHLDADFAAGKARPPRVAVITNLTPNHLDWHTDWEEYCAAKRVLLSYQGAADWAVLNADDPLLREWSGKTPGRAVLTSLKDPGGDDAGFLLDGEIVIRLGGETAARIGLDRFRLLGSHNRVNAVQAASAAYVFSRNADAVLAGLADFPGLPHRLENVREVAGRVFINDSKATTPEAAVTAMHSLDRPFVLIAGGYDKHSPFAALARTIQERASALVLVGAAAGRLGAAVREASASRPEGMGALPIIEAGEDFPLAVAEAWRLTPEGGAVLLSPACASYGMFVNYEERGRRFRELADAQSE